ncbi:hypothetical protein Hanom_Chr01g00027091 [Helianthus anomalus]
MDLPMIRNTWKTTKGRERKMKCKKGMIFVEEASSCLLEFHQLFVEEINSFE